MAMLTIMADAAGKTVKTVVPDPSGMTYGLMDVSDANAGRTTNLKMHKNRKGQKRKLSLVWNGPRPGVASQILRAFNPEYVYLKYFDTLDNKEETREFYVGDRTAPVKVWQQNNKIYETLSFEVIER